MAIVFPVNPSVNDTFTVGSITYKWDSTKWIGLGVTPADRLVEGSNSLEINASNNLVWTGGNLLVGMDTVYNMNATAQIRNGINIVAQDFNGDVTQVSLAGEPVGRILFGDTRPGTYGEINCIADGVCGTNDYPGRLVFRTTSDGSSNTAERMRITSSGQLLIHHTQNVAPDGYESMLQLADDSYQGSSTVWKRAAGSSAGANPALILQKVRGADINGQGAVSDSDSIGQIRFYGADGTTAIECGNISATVDNTTSTNNVPGKLVFKTAKLLAGQGSPVNPTQAMTIKANHNVEIHDGNIVFETAGTGIDFSANANATGMTSELLDDYEEGTWTPVITSAGYTLIGASTSGYYTKIGNLVSVHFQARFSAVGSNTASASFSGLPFTSNSAFHHAGVCRESTAYGDIFVAQVSGGNSTIALNSMDGVVNGDNAAFVTNRNYNTQLTYFV